MGYLEVRYWVWNYLGDFLVIFLLFVYNKYSCRERLVLLMLFQNRDSIHFHNDLTNPTQWNILPNFSSRAALPTKSCNQPFDHFPGWTATSPSCLHSGCWGGNLGSVLLLSIFCFFFHCPQHSGHRARMLCWEWSKWLCSCWEEKRIFFDQIEYIAWLENCWI